MTIVLALVLAHQDGPPTAGALVSKMFARYHDAKTVKGSCTTLLRVGAQEITIQTEVQVQRPLKARVSQSVSGAKFLVVSDGKSFVYTKPLATPDSDRNPTGLLKEPVVEGMTLGDIYRAAAQSLAERSIVLDLAFSDRRDLERLRNQWKTLDLTGEVEWNGEKVYRIVGDWRVEKDFETTAKFGLYVTKDGELRRYVIDQLESVGEVKASREYTVNLTLDGPVDDKLFAVPK